MVHSPIHVAASRAYDGLVRFTFDPIRELLSFKFLPEFLIVDELQRKKTKDMKGFLA
jgi:hypothetical protein